MRLPAALPLDTQRNQSGASYMAVDRKRGTLVRIPVSPTGQVGLGSMVIRPTSRGFFSFTFPLLFQLSFSLAFHLYLVVSCCHLFCFRA